MKTAARRLAAVWLCAALHAPAGAATDGAPLHEKFDALVREGFDRPDAALRELQSLDPAVAAAADRRGWMLAQGTVLAQSGRDAEAQAWRDALLRHAHEHRDAQAEAAAMLVGAISAQTAARFDRAAPLAQSALDTLRNDCPGLSEAAAAGAVPAAANGNRMRPPHRMAGDAGAAAVRVPQGPVGQRHRSGTLGTRPGGALG
jgi:hypothetical protein